MNEFKTIARIKALLGAPQKSVRLGIGDDAAVVIVGGTEIAICSDAMVEGVHFDLNFTRPRQLGRKAVGQCLSDLAAMNSTPSAVLISLAVPAATEDSFIDEFYLGAGELVRSLHCDIVGGDLTSSPNGIYIDISCLGGLDPGRAWLTRSGAQVGDAIYVSGYPGAAAAGLLSLRQTSLTEEENKKGEPEWIKHLHLAHLEPTPRFSLLPSLNQRPGLCTSLIDLSDGLSSELHHLAKASDLGFEIDSSLLPIHPAMARLAGILEKSGQSTVPAQSIIRQWALGGGEDYELLATISPAELTAVGGHLEGFKRIGQVTNAKGVWISETGTNRKELKNSGFKHFT